MGSSLRCCLACMLPCGALDVVRVVHLSGHVDEFTCPLTAADVLAAHPNHALTAAWSAGAARKIVIVSPDSELRRGRIYFLIPPACSAPAVEMKRRKNRACGLKKKCHVNGHRGVLLSEKREQSYQRRRSGASAGVWRPQLESIEEEPSEAQTSDCINIKVRMNER